MCQTLKFLGYHSEESTKMSAHILENFKSNLWCNRREKTEKGGKGTRHSGKFQQRSSTEEAIRSIAFCSVLTWTTGLYSGTLSQKTTMKGAVKTIAISERCVVVRIGFSEKMRF